MNSLVHTVLSRYALVCFSLLYTPRGAAQTTSGEARFIGTWGVNVPQLGWLALDVSRYGTDKVGGVRLWWFVEEAAVKPTFDGNRLRLSRRDAAGVDVAALDFELTENRALRLLPGGFLPNPLAPPLAALELQRLPDERWHYLTSYMIDSSEYLKWHDHGALRPLPPDWPTVMVEAFVRLFRYNDHVLVRGLEFPSLSAATLATAYQWTLKDPHGNEGPAYRQRYIASNPNCDKATLKNLWDLPEQPQIWRAVALNPSAPTDWRQAYIERVLSGSERIKSMAAWDTKAPVELHLRLMRESYELRRTLATSRGLAPDIYEALAREYPKETWESLLVNADAPAGIIERIAKEGDESFRARVIEHPSLSAETRRQIVLELARTAKGPMITKLAPYPDVPPETLDRFANYPEHWARVGVARNPSTSEQTLRRLAGDENGWVAGAAREALQKRFPTAFGELRAGWTPLERLDADLTPEKYWSRAVERGDLAELQKWLPYFSERRELEGILGRGIAEAMKSYRPQLMDFLLEQMKPMVPANTFATRLAGYAGAYGGSREWVRYFKQRSALEKENAFVAYAEAIRGRKLDTVKALVAEGVDLNVRSNRGETPLLLAVSMRDLASVEVLITAGADVRARDAQGRTAADLAAATRFLAAIKLVDVDGKHRDLIDRFAKEFPAQPRSAFLGQWSNNKGEFSTIITRFDPDGTAIFSAAIASALIAWREKTDHEVEAFMFSPQNGELLRSVPLVFRLNTAGDELQFERPGQPPEKMTRKSEPR